MCVYPTQTKCATMHILSWSPVLSDMSVVEIEWETFDPNKLRGVYGPIMLVGKSGAGKNKGLENILYHRRDEFELVMAFTKTGDVNPDLARFMGPGFIYKDIDNEAIKNLYIYAQKRSKDRERRAAYARQQYLYEKQSDPDGARVRLHQRLVEINQRKGICVIFDDVTSDKNALNYSKYVTGLFTEGRHFDIFTVVLMQNAMTAMPDLRGQARYVFAWQQDSELDYKNLFSNYFQSFGTFKNFQRTFPELTANFGCLVSKLKAGDVGTTLESRVAVYRAPKSTPRFVLGSADYWRTHEADYDPEALDRINAISIGGPANGGINRAILDSKQPRTIIHRTVGGGIIGQYATANNNTATSSSSPSQTYQQSQQSPAQQQQPMSLSSPSTMPAQDRTALESYLKQMNDWEMATSGTRRTTWADVEARYWQDKQQRQQR